MKSFTENLLRYSLPFFIVAVIARGIEEISLIYYAVPVLCLLYIILFLEKLWHEYHSRKSNNTNSPVYKAALIILILIIISGLWFLATSLWSVYPEVSVNRSLYFILIAAGSFCAGLLFVRTKTKVNRRRRVSLKAERLNKSEEPVTAVLNVPDNIEPAADIFIPANILVVVVCLFSLLTGIPSDSWTMGRGFGFGGYFGHQNLLASVLLFTLPGVVISIKDKGKKITGISILYFILLSLNFILLALTWSRSAWLSLFIGVIVYLFLTRKFKSLLTVFSLTVLIIVSIYSITPLRSEAYKLLNKGFPELYSSRMLLWEPSFNTATKGGLTGLGYGVSDPDFVFPEGATGSHYTDGIYEREKGNSILALVEESGVIGLFLFLLSIVILIKNGCRDVWMHDKFPNTVMQSFNHAIILSSFISFIIHSQFEAWMVGIGSVQLPLFFIYVGLLSGITTEKNEHT